MVSSGASRRAAFVSHKNNFTPIHFRNSRKNLLACSMSKKINDLLRVVTNFGASDLQLKTSPSPTMRLSSGSRPVADASRLTQDGTPNTAFASKVDTDPDSRNNNFDFIRMLAASFVIFAHAYDLLTPPAGVATNSEPFKVFTSGQLSLGSLGVSTFFCISGYLITQSLLRSRDYSSYFVKRGLRILPALIVDLLISAFIWGPLVTTLTLAEYFSNPLTYRYLLNFSLYNISYVLPGVFTNNIYPNTVNGSIWTLPLEAVCYSGIVLLHFCFILRNRRVYALFYFLTLAVGFVLVNSRYHAANLFETGVVLEFLFTYAAYFGAGALILLYKDKILFNSTISLLLCFVWVVAMYFGIGYYVSYFCLPYIVLWFAFEPRIRLHNAGRFGDFSYGLYIYAFPVQQTISYVFNGDISVAMMTFLSFLFTVPLAMFSWFAIEKPAMQLKARIFKNERSAA